MGAGRSGDCFEVAGIGTLDGSGWMGGLPVLVAVAVGAVGHVEGGVPGSGEDPFAGGVAHLAELLRVAGQFDDPLQESGFAASDGQTVCGGRTFHGARNGRGTCLRCG